MALASTATDTLAAPAASKVRVHSAKVAPVVMTSSMTKTCLEQISAGPGTVKAPATAEARAAGDPRPKLGVSTLLANESGTSFARICEQKLVGAGGIEPPTPTVSR